MRCRGSISLLGDSDGLPRLRDSGRRRPAQAQSGRLFLVEFRLRCNARATCRREIAAWQSRRHSSSWSSCARLRRTTTTTPSLGLRHDRRRFPLAKAPKIESLGAPMPNAVIELTISNSPCGVVIAPHPARRKRRLRCLGVAEALAWHAARELSPISIRHDRAPPKLTADDTATTVWMLKICHALGPTKPGFPLGFPRLVSLYSTNTDQSVRALSRAYADSPGRSGDVGGTLSVSQPCRRSRDSATSPDVLQTPRRR